MKQGAVICCFVALIILFISLASAHHCEIATHHLPLKVSLPEGSSALKNFSLTSELGGEFILESTVSGVTLSEHETIFNKGETRLFSAYFNSTGLKPGVYTGWIGSTNKKERFHIPVIFEIEAKDVFFDVNLEIPPVYTEVNPGDKVVGQAKIFDLVSNKTQKLGPSKVRLEYKVYKIHDGEISSSSETIVVDGTTETTLSLDISDETDCDEYVFAVAVKYGSSVGVASRFFVISLPENFIDRSLRDSDHATFLIIVGILGAIIIILIILFIVFLRPQKRYEE
ncbi:hypothetical protein HYZ97_01945 [Candidatus Pacearchaeota archaeon]|nr:hypothetical protein [Candidatus Pacearchaeota archaeon]